MPFFSPRRLAATAASCLVAGLAGMPASASAQLPIPPLPTVVPGTTIPTDPTALAALLQSVATDPTQLQAIVGAVDPTALAAAVATLAPAQVTQLAQTLGLAPAASATPTPAAPVATATPFPGSSGTPAPTVDPAVRARVTKVRVARNRRTATVTLRCPIVACGVGLTGKVGTHKAFKPKYVPASKGRTVARVKLTTKARQVLRKAGGRLRVVATTAGSTAPPAKKSVRVARPKRAR